ncbi:cation diffusion facilitator family transporter [Elusimicrobium posterum]|uniref:cation diffusion facilitator family transporter n=1 Tax=Elusimicrobium posterum TaxID=3116653 RepID=UPI003C739613
MNNAQRVKETNKITFICMAGNIMLAVLKLLAGVLGASAAMIADAMHSFSDLVTDIVLLIGVKLSNKPEDAKHPYGHGRIETFATLIISIVLLFAAFGILWGGVQSIIKVIAGETLPKPGYIALIMAAVSIISKEVMYRYTVAVGKKIDSLAVISNAWHHRSDALSSIGTFIGIGGAILLGHKWTVLDPITAVIVSFFIFNIAFTIFKLAVEEMLDVALPQESVDKISELACSVPGVHKPHSIKTRKIGYRTSIDLHIILDKETSFTEVYCKMNLIKYKLRDQFGKQTFISIHPQPLTTKFETFPNPELPGEE